jgi:phage terminase large subunit-like protein
MMLRDWAAVNFHFRKGDLRCDIGRYWICTRNPELFRVKAPWQTWDTCIPVDEPEMPADMIADYIAEMARSYNIKKIAMDNYRYALMKDALNRIGFDPKERKNLYLVRPSDIMKVQPVIDSCFNNQYFVEYNLATAASVVSIIPILIIFLAFQRWMVKAVVMSGVKG